MQEMGILTRRERGRGMGKVEGDGRIRRVWLEPVPVGADRRWTTAGMDAAVS